MLSIYFLLCYYLIHQRETRMKHKWANEIKAWADGAEIEKWMLNDTWQIELRPGWYDYERYRIKPQPKELQYLYVSKGDNGKPELSFIDHQESIGKIKLETDDA